MIRMTDLSKEEKQSLETLLQKLHLLPPKSCQIVFHCAQGTVQAIEYAKFTLK